MLTATLIHIPGIGKVTEEKLWENGLIDWSTPVKWECLDLTSSKKEVLAQHIDESRKKLTEKDAAYFEHLLPSGQHFRLFKQFRDKCAYLDIETTGLDNSAVITTIALYDGAAIQHFVHGKNLHHFPDVIKKYPILVTYNGRSFDIPFIENYFNIKLSCAQIDLRYILAGLGFKGGLKKCEKAMGIDRKELSEVDGYFAVLLWKEYMRGKNPKVLETLLAYNVEDVINLETLLIKAHNLYVEKSVLPASFKIKMAESPENPFQADPAIIENIRSRYGYY